MDFKKSTKISSSPIWKILASLKLPNLRKQSEYEGKNQHFVLGSVK
jgi:hypothetical protein